MKNNLIEEYYVIDQSLFENKNSSFRNERSQTFIDSFYYMDLIYSYM